MPPAAPARSSFQVIADGKKRVQLRRDEARPGRQAGGRGFARRQDPAPARQRRRRRHELRPRRLGGRAVHRHRRETRALSSCRTKSHTCSRPSPAPPRASTGRRSMAARPGHPFLYRIPAQGERPMTFSASGLPKGLQLDAADRHHHRHEPGARRIQGHAPREELARQRQPRASRSSAATRFRSRRRWAGIIGMPTTTASPTP